ncbi:MAG: hypothetical protein HYU66_10030, partial [Armatimonadetes bacterium]|nr:hypothetical protein [Armatimonadota bacterium]
AHEGVIYLAYYISHVGDVTRGSKTASLKVHQVFDYPGFAAHWLSLGKRERPTADGARMARFGAKYPPPLTSFAREQARLY